MAAEVNKPDFQYVWASGGSKVAPSDVKVQTGWTAEVPPFQWENWSQNRQDDAILHLFQKGISEWDTLSDYYFTAAGVRSYVQGSDGQIYVAVQDSIGQNPVTDTSNTYWRLAFNNQGASRISGLRGSNSGTTPNTQLDFSAVSVVLRNSTTGSTVVFTNTAVITNNILTAGPVANGRDQVGAFPAAGWVHFWYISDGINLATISSASSTSPTLPAGYRYQAYIGAVVISASALLAVKFRGAWTNYDTPRTVVAGGTATVDTAFSTANYVPPNALEWRMQVQNLANTATGAGVYSLTLVVDGGYQSGLQGQGVASAVSGVSGGTVNLPNMSQSATYRLVVNSGTGPTCTINAGAYKNPNGGE